ncbi:MULTISPECIES: Panacea domain-containing protein [Corynebacterium]|uniref:Panacea domain-containing protein n=1 Tax=Corynebacterium TaxID=1716 RepID=UPI00178C735E|nr:MULTISPECIES: type II toxin-antitoxin system antitoxin SocA domain-containing protein [Corynebacterium]
MTTGRDVAAYIVDQYGEHDKLQLMKLAYFIQAWSLTWDGVPAFDSRIEAWKHGPVAKDIYNVIGGKYRPDLVSSVPGGDSANVDARVRAIVSSIMDCFGGLQSEALVEETHKFSAWITAGGDLAENDSSNEEITHGMMQAWHSRQLREGGGRIPLRPQSVVEIADNASFMSAFKRQKANWCETERRLAAR